MFRNLAKQMGHFYFRSHGAESESDEGRGWQHDDVYLEEERFVDLIRGAVASMDHRGILDQDVD
jgi:protein O-GlcNAc transferase